MERSQVTTLMVFLLFFVSCGQNKNTQSDKQDSMQENSIENDIRVNTALLFINSYIEQGVTVEEWLKTECLVTDLFIDKYKKMIDEGWKEDPEMGLGYDPILSAQDYPDKGFEFDSIDQNNNCVFLKGKGEAQFKVVVRVVEKNSKWLVDGAGVVNMPNL